MGGHPLLKMSMGGGEVKVIEGVIAIVERGAGECVDGKQGRGKEGENEEKEEPKCGKEEASRGFGGELRERYTHNEHPFLLPHFIPAWCCRRY
jgi:hypothetical protein